MIFRSIKAFSVTLKLFLSKSLFLCLILFISLTENPGVEIATLHCDLNAIELVWSLAKRKVASNNIKLTKEEFEKLIKESFESVTPGDWKKITEHIIHIENKYKERDRITEENLESFIINVGNSDTSSSDSDKSMHVEFLDSDFDYSE